MSKDAFDWRKWNAQYNAAWRVAQAAIEIIEAMGMDSVRNVLLAQLETAQSAVDKLVHEALTIEEQIRKDSEQ